MTAKRELSGTDEAENSPKKFVKTVKDGKTKKFVKKNIKDEKTKKFEKKGDDKTTKGEKLPKDTAATRKERKLTRKQQKPTYELSHKALKLWERLRVAKSDVSKKDKHNLVAELLKIMKHDGQKMTKLAYAHDTSRVLQSCLKQGNEAQRTEIFDGLKDEILPLIKNKYAKNIIWKMVLYGTPVQRKEIIFQFTDVPRLIKKPLPASVIEYAYNTFANEEQRRFLISQLYGNMFTYTKTTDKMTLRECVDGFPDKKEGILQNFRDVLRPLIEKEVMVHTLVHKAFYEFFTCCDIASIRSEVIESLRESLIHIIHTHDGAQVGMHCLWHGNAKDRKVIVKTFKEFLEKLCTEEFGHLCLLASFDVVDDTVFMKKAILSPIIKLLPKLLENKYGRKVVTYLISPRKSSHFLPETSKLLATGDGNVHSKKAKEVRQIEIRDAVSPGIVEYVANNVEKLATNKAMFPIVETALLNCSGDVSPISNAIIELVKKNFKPDKNHIVENVAGHLLIKRLVLNKSEGHNNIDFGKAILDSVNDKQLAKWSACNRGGLILLSLVENKNNEVSEKAKKMLLKQLDEVTINEDVNSTKALIAKLS